MKTAENLSIEELQNKLADQGQKITALSHENAYLEEQLSRFKRQLFGKRSDKDFHQSQ